MPSLILGLFSSACILLLATPENSLIAQKYSPNIWLGSFLACIPLLLVWMSIGKCSVKSFPQENPLRGNTRGRSIKNAASEADACMDEFVSQYFQNARERLTSQGDRLWNRFNYFLTIETALVGAFFIRPDHLGSGLRLYGLGVLGIISSLVWFLIAAQDLWFYEDRYKKLKQIEKDLISAKVPFIYEPNWQSELPTWKKFLCFKIPQCGSTTFSAICPALFFVLWIALMFLEIYF